MRDRIVLVTGGTAGVGLATARELAARGADVTLIGSNAQRGEGAVRTIRATAPNAAVAFERADLSLMSEVRRVARNFVEKRDRLDVLVNNAGAIFSTRRETAEGLEATFALNHLGVFLLTNLLLERLRAAEGGRIIVTASTAHYPAQLDFDDLQLVRGYSARTAYRRSKLANVMFANALARRLEGGSVTANSLHPGLVASRFGSNNGPVFRWAVRLFFLLGGAVGVEAGARTGIRLACDPELAGVSGKYFDDCRSVDPSPASMVLADQERLWSESEKLLGSVTAGSGR